MAFSLTPASAFVDAVTKLTAATLNYWRTAISQAIDGTGGSGGVPYTPVTAIEVEGAGLYGDPLWGWVRSGKFLAVDTGANLWIYGTGTVQPGGAFYVDGALANPGILQVKQYGIASVLSGGSLLISGGASFVTLTDFYVQGSAVVRIGNPAVGPGALLVDASGSATGTYLTVQGGAWATVTGTGSRLQVMAAAMLLVDAGSVVLQNGSTLLVGALATFNGAVVLNNTTTLNGAVTQNALYTKSGAAARTALRCGTVSTTLGLDPDSALTFDPSQLDVIHLREVLTADRVWKMAAPPGGVSCRVLFLFSNNSTGGTWKTVIQTAAGVDIAWLLDYGANPGGAGMELVYDQTLGVWTLGMIYGAAVQSRVP